jgi:electron transport complex protein RnfC
MGGAMFPTHVKLSVPEDKEVEYFILNGAECEPYLTVDQRIMIECPDDVLLGMKALMKAAEINKGYIGIEDNKPEAIASMRQAVNKESGIEVKVLATKYPQGGEKMLVEAILDREVPEGGLPLDVGVVVNNVSTALAVRNAIKEGMPLIERAVSITGPGVKETANLICRLGTPVKELIDEVGGYKDNPGQVVMGGPMMGVAQSSTEVPVVKGDVCPSFLLPVQLANYSKHEMYEELEKYRVLNCIECGSCSYICPANRPLLHHIKIGKAEVMVRQKNEE